LDERICLEEAMGYDLATMKPKFWLTIVTCLAWCIDRELYKALIISGTSSGLGGISGKAE